jgi:ubiquinone/menaquinone biosynthesis C-methylase UbiE
MNLNQHDSPPSPTLPSPALLFETINSYQRSAAIKGAIELDLFSIIAQGHSTAQDIAAQCQASARGVRILCDYLVIIGFLTKTENNYALTPDSAVFLDRGSPAYMGGIVGFLLSPMLIDSFQDVAAVVRNGGTALPTEGSLAPEHPAWVDFARAMAPMMAMPAQLMTKLVRFGPEQDLKVLDIAAGHGIFGITMAKHFPNARITAQDWSNVLQVAQENAQAAGITDRYELLPGSAFDVELGDGYDLILLTNFLHHFDAATCEDLLRKVHRALSPNGQVITLEFVPNADRISPPIAAAFSLIMLATTPSGDAYTFGELEAMFRNAGFSRSEFHPLPPTPGQAVLSYR